MTPEDREKLSGSLFKPTSAFVQPLDVPYPVEVVVPHSTLVSSSSSDWADVAALISHILLVIDDRRDEASDLVRDIETALEELEREVNKHA